MKRIVLFSSMLVLASCKSHVRQVAQLQAAVPANLTLKLAVKADDNDFVTLVVCQPHTQGRNYAQAGVYSRDASGVCLYALHGKNAEQRPYYFNNPTLTLAGFADVTRNYVRRRLLWTGMMITGVVAAVYLGVRSNNILERARKLERVKNEVTGFASNRNVSADKLANYRQQLEETIDAIPDDNMRATLYKHLNDDNIDGAITSLDAVTATMRDKSKHARLGAIAVVFGLGGATVWYFVDSLLLNESRRSMAIIKKLFRSNSAEASVEELWHILVLLRRYLPVYINSDIKELYLSTQSAN